MKKRIILCRFRLVPHQQHWQECFLMSLSSLPVTTFALARVDILICNHNASYNHSAHETQIFFEKLSHSLSCLLRRQRSLSRIFLKNCPPSPARVYIIYV